MIRDLGLLSLRVFAGLSLAFAHGLGKIPPSESFVEGIANMGFPAPDFFAWCAGAAEFGGGLLLALGLWTRFSAASVALTLFVAAFMRHAADPYKMKELALLYFFVSIAFVGHGAGRFSLDHFLPHRKVRRK